MSVQMAWYVSSLMARSFLISAVLRLMLASRRLRSASPAVADVSCQDPPPARTRTLWVDVFAAQLIACLEVGSPGLKRGQLRLCTGNLAIEWFMDNCQPGVARCHLMMGLALVKLCRVHHLNTAALGWLHCYD